MCTTNLQTTRCYGICSALRDCQSCLIHGENICKWCVQNSKCHSTTDREVCGENDNSVYQWWGSKGIWINDKQNCSTLDRPPGVTYLKYLYPYDWNMPDSVNIINSTSIEFNTNTAPSIDNSNSGEVIARIHGFLHLPENYIELIKVCGSYGEISLKNSEEKEALKSFHADQNICHLLNMNELKSGKNLLDLKSRRQPKSQLHILSKIALQNSNSKPFQFNFLEPYSKGNCEINSNCFQCLSDNSCGWCEIKNKCFARDENPTLVCSESNNWSYLTLIADKCINCSNFISCHSCSQSENCEWWSEDAKCERRGRSSAAIKDPFECAVPCHERVNCSECLNTNGKCVWCQATSQCFSFSVYTSEYQFGICREWIDQLTISSGASNNNGQHQCKSCSMFKNCSSCLKRLSCGWCYLEENPFEGDYCTK